MAIQRICAYAPCGASFTTLSLTSRFCSKACGRSSQSIMGDEEIKQYLLGRVVIPKDPGKCWLWTGSLNDAGYGMAFVKKDAFRAHRLSYELFIGAIPSGLDILHSEKCSTRACINPLHLRPGTNAENVQDRLAFGSQPRGSSHYATHFEERDALAILRLYHEKHWTYKALAKRYDVAIVTIHDIIQRITWQHVRPNLYAPPEQDGRTTVTEDDVRTIRRLRQEGMPLKEVAQRFGITVSQTWRIAKRLAWPDVE